MCSRVCPLERVSSALTWSTLRLDKSPRIAAQTAPPELPAAVLMITRCRGFGPECHASSASAENKTELECAGILAPASPQEKAARHVAVSSLRLPPFFRLRSGCSKHQGITIKFAPLRRFWRALAHAINDFCRKLALDPIYYPIIFAHPVATNANGRSLWYHQRKNAEL
jgi:hypothetical protein